jgi:hypothetical protein
MSELKEVAVMIEPPVDGTPGSVSYGRYAIEDGKVVMYGEDDAPMIDRRGNRYERELAEEITPEQIAALLTKKIRGDLGWAHNDFNRPLRLPKEKLV